ncbi:MarR family winged helix-turn-helix transcriptional regulator [Marinicella sp. W31]|uniref:MarR family winged helix-turn-helix transcriptional regulator n=1 Tax=Marinicella sp. W31 TaxID=3023713 RepID=UPI003756B3F8
MDKNINQLGALALALTDRIKKSLKETYDRSGESAAAIIVIGYVQGLSVEVLRQVLSLSHPGTVRLIDRLAEDDLVERRKAKDGRAVALHLTDKGLELRQLLMKNRLDVIEASVQNFTIKERETFFKLISKALKNLPESEMAKHQICRLCDTRYCEDCPIPGNAV